MAVASSQSDRQRPYMNSRENVFSRIVTQRIQDCKYWKTNCFAINAAQLCEHAADLKTVGCFDTHHKPTEFLCLLYKLILIAPGREIIEEFLHQPWFKYLTALACVYIRFMYKPSDIYTLLEPLLADYRKLRVSDPDPRLSYVDELVDELLTRSQFCSLALPRLANRLMLEEKGLPAREALLSSNDDDDEESESPQDSGL